MEPEGEHQVGGVSGGVAGMKLCGPGPGMAGGRRIIQHQHPWFGGGGGSAASLDEPGSNSTASASAVVNIFAARASG
ncbi:hypothetical protein [Glutamicibacter arilaitensis]|uniref:hypothetical protein n=1 Tax=Glutamicibacter arilaitensis TaxID=256701 RepID=UPI001CA4777A|nr:hypothetical protein [Glutamicibacter arilaitensis]